MDLSAAVGARANYLLTLDARLARAVNRAGLSLRVLSPGHFIKTIVPDHVEYPSIG